MGNDNGNGNGYTMIIVPDNADIIELAAIMDESDAKSNQDLPSP